MTTAISSHESLFRASPQPMWTCDTATGAILDVNDAAVILYGYSRDQFLKLALDDLRAPGSLPEGAAAGDPWTGLAVHRRADGTQILVEASSHAIEREGRSVRLMLLLDVSQRLAAEVELRRVSQEYRALSARLLAVQEEERRHLARELHDEIGQSLSALKIALQSLGVRPDAHGCQVQVPGCHNQIGTAIGIADATLEQVRRISLDLRPPQLDDLGVAAAIRWNLERQGRLAGIEADFGATDVPERLPEAIAIACYRIAQEAVTNAIRHASARRLRVRLWREAAELRLSVEDDGAGFDLAAFVHSERAGASMGIAGMRERAALAGGRLELASAPGQGCSVLAQFPLAEHGSGA